jgi:hypothetical protein
MDSSLPQEKRPGEDAGREIRYDTRVEAKRNLVRIGDFIVGAALTVGFVPLLRQFLPENLAIFGLYSPFVYLCWRGYISVLRCVGGCVFIIFVGLLLWAKGAGIVDWVWLYSLFVLACLIFGGLQTYPWRTTDGPP